MDGAKFFKFPKTEHLPGSNVVDDDQTISTDVIKAWGGTNMIVQEKMDGANVGVHFSAEWEPVIQKRGGIVGSGEKSQYDVWRNWVYEHMEVLWEILGTEYCLFGEWLWARHSVGIVYSYNALPDFFLAFDLLRKRDEVFLSHEEMHKVLKGRVHTVPLLWSGKPSGDVMAQLTAVAASKHGSEMAEGVYVRWEANGRVVGRAKWRRGTFTAGRADFNTKQENNSLAAGK